MILLIILFAMVFGCALSEKKAKKHSMSALKKTDAKSSQIQKKREPVAGPGEQETKTLPGREKQYLFYPSMPEQPKLQFLVSFSSNGINEFNLGNQNTLNLDRPYDINATEGKIYISDRTFKKISVIDLEKKQLSYVAGDYESAGIWVTKDDIKYIADFDKKQIAVFNSDNKLIRVYDGEDRFDKPVDVAVFQNKIYVCDINKHHIITMDKDSGKTIQEFGGIGTEEGKFYKPTHVVVDIHGNIYVNDLFNFRIQKFDPAGNFIKSFGHAGDSLGSFARPKGLDIDKDGYLYVVDAAFENVQIFDDETTDLVLFFGGFGLDDGQMYLPGPIHIDYQNVEYFRKYAKKYFILKYLVYVGNTLGPAKINVYGFGDWIGPASKNTENEVKK